MTVLRYGGTFPVNCTDCEGFGELPERNISLSSGLNSHDPNPIRPKTKIKIKIKEFPLHVALNLNSLLSHSQSVAREAGLANFPKQAFLLAHHSLPNFLPKRTRSPERMARVAFPDPCLISQHLLTSASCLMSHLPRCVPGLGWKIRETPGQRFGDSLSEWLDRVSWDCGGPEKEWPLARPNVECAIS